MASSEAQRLAQAARNALTSPRPRPAGAARHVAAGSMPVAVVREPTRFWDDREQAWIVAVLAGEVYVTDRDEQVTTVLGSCVSACVRHPGTGAGGMNHLVLPDNPRGQRTLRCDGVASLERLLSGVLAYGGRSSELEVKIFGGGRVIAGSSDVGQLNITAVSEYFAERGIAIASADIGGGLARRLRFEPRTGRVRIQRTVMRQTGAPTTW